MKEENKILSARELLIQNLRAELGINEDEEVTLQMVEDAGRKLTPAEFATLMGWNTIPKFPRKPPLYKLRKMFNQLSKEELRVAHKEEQKAEKVERGMVKIYNLLARAGV